jgi:phosphate starvation-inducible protein PhoH and related proteins
MNSKSKRRKPSHEEMDEAYEALNNSKPSLDSLRTVKIELKCKNKNQKIFADHLENKEVVICSGPAGTGKTYVACAQALKLIKNDDRYKKIYIVKSVTTLKDEEIGFLKGTMEEKMEPFVYSFIHNFEKITNRATIQFMRSNGVIQIMPIAYLRGINFDDCIVLIDECQNITPDNMHTIMTRLGTNCKMIFLGDTAQIDLKNKRNSSLRLIMDKFSSLEEFGVIEFSDEDIVRNPLIKKIESVFKEISETPGKSST